MFPHRHEANLRTANRSPLPNHHSGHSQSSSLTRTTPNSLLLLMSQNPSTAASSTKFQVIINGALKVYNNRTKDDLLLHPLATELQNCESPTDILAVLHQQVQGLDQSRSGDDRWTKWLDPTIHVILTFSQAAGTVGLVCPMTSAYPRSAH